MASASAASTPSPPLDDGALTHKQIVTILIGLMMGMFLAALDQTIVASAMRVIADDLKDLAGQAWVTTAYLITSTIVTPLYGKLSDIYGRKKWFVTAITIFVLGSVLCSFATSIPMLAAFRAVQGLGAGGLFSLALAIIGDIVPPRERAKYQGYFLAVFGTSSVLGPVIGGFFAGPGDPAGHRRLALGLPGQRPDRHRRPRRRQPHAAPAAHPPGPPDRLVGRRGADRGPGPAAARRRAGPHLGLELRPLDHLLRHRRHRRRRVLPGRADDGRRGAAADQALPEPHRRHLLDRLGHPRHGPVRGHRLPAALPADRQGRLAHRGRAAAAADDPRHHDRLDRLRPDDLAHRPLPALPDHRLGAAGDLAVRVPLHRRRHPAVAVR